MSKAAARTGIMPMAVVAVEQYFPQAERVIDDSLAARLLPLGAVIFVRLLQSLWVRDWLMRLAEKCEPGIWGAMLCRKRYIDEKLVASRNGMEAMVNLGAGFERSRKTGRILPLLKLACRISGNSTRKRTDVAYELRFRTKVLIYSILRYSMQEMKLERLCQRLPISGL
jgi:hypothetical protein